MEILWHQLAYNVVGLVILILVVETVINAQGKKSKKVVYKQMRKYSRIGYILVIPVLLFVSNPFKMVVDDTATEREQKYVAEVKIKPRVTVATETFEEFNQKSLNQMQDESKEYFNETIK